MVTESEKRIIEESKNPEVQVPITKVPSLPAEEPKVFTEEERKAQQRRIGILEKELKEAQERAMDTASVKSEIAYLKEMQTLQLQLLQKQQEGGLDYGTTETPASNIASEIQKLQARLQQETARTADIRAATKRIEEMAIEAGIELSDDSVTDAKNLCEKAQNPNDLDVAKETMRKYTVKVLKEQAKTTQEEDRKKEEIHKLAKVDTGGPSAASRGFKQIEQAYAEGKVSTAEYLAAMKEYGKI